MSCWDRFDRKVVLYYTGNKDTRVPGMERELERVGLQGADRQWQFPTPFDNLLLRSVRHDPWVGVGYLSNAMSHYRAISIAYHLGCRNVLILEDDVRFMKDVGMVSNYIDTIPDGYDVAKMDSVFKEFGGNGVTLETMSKWRGERKANEFWSEFDSLYSTGCYALSRKGMERMMFCFEAVETNKDIGMLRVVDHFLDRKILGADMKMYFSRENVCVQKEFECVTGYGEIEKRYRAMGVDMGKYAE